MKNMKKIISFVLITALMMTFLPAMALTAMASETGVRIELSNTTVTITEGTTATVKVPVRYPDNVDTPVYDIPEVLEVYVDGVKIDDYTATDAQAIPGSITVTMGETVYTLGLELVGKNMYTNGGAENGVWTANYGTRTWVNGNAGKGNYSVLVQATHFTPDGENPYKTVYADKKYLASSMVKANEGSGIVSVWADVYTPSGGSFGNRNSTTFKCFDENGNEKTNSTYTVSEDAWATGYRVIDVTADTTIVDVYHDSKTYTAKNKLFDEVFLGELVASELNISSTTIENSSLFIPENGQETHQLTAKALNQLGNPAGITTSNVKFIDDGIDDGVSVTEAGLLTIDSAKVKAGKYTISAIANAQVSDTDIYVIKGKLELSILDEAALIGALESVSFDSAYVDFAFDTQSYDVYVPVYYADNVDNYTYKVPAISSYKFNNMSDGCYAVVENASAVPGTSRILTYNEDDELLKTYTFNFKFVGKNMHTNGGAEAGDWNVSFGSRERTQSFPGKGSYAVLLNSGNFFLPDDSKVPSLKEGKTYLSSSMVRSDDASVTTFSADVFTPNGGIFKTRDNTTFTSYDADGNLKNNNSYTISTTEWTTGYRLVKAKVDTTAVDTFGYQQVQKRVVDEIFMGEVAAYVNVCDANGKSSANILVGSGAEFELTSSISNQLGNNIGLNSKLISLSVVGNPDGITLENGVVTVADTVEKGTYYVEALYETGIENGTQTYAKGAFAITVGDITVDYEEMQDGNISVSVTFVGETGEYKYINAVYDIDVNGELVFKWATPVEAQKSADAPYTNSAELENVTDGQVIRTYFWKASDLTPVAKPYTFKK